MHLFLAFGININMLSGIIIGAAIEVHRLLRPGLLESAYEACLAFELKERGLKVERQVELPLCYKGNHLDCGYRLDLLVNDILIVEIKAVNNWAFFISISTSIPFPEILFAFI